MLRRPPALARLLHCRFGPIRWPITVTRVSIALLFTACFAPPAPRAGDPAAEPSAKLKAPLRSFLDGHCVGCHDAGSKKGGLDLDTTPFEPGDPRNFSRWVKVLDRVNAGEMPPKKSPRPDAKESASFSKSLASVLTAADRQRVARDGRAGRRRLNRHEYENTLRDLLCAPWLQVKEMLPEDGVAHRFNKVGEALDVSHVQMARYLIAADYALREAMANRVDRPLPTTVRYYAREQRSFTGKFKYSVFNTAPERAMFPTLGSSAQPEVRAGKEPLTVGRSDPKRREQEGVGLVCSAYEPIEPTFNKFRAPMTGNYRLRFNAHSVWVGPNGSSAVGSVANAGPKKWFIPNFDDVFAGRRSEPITIYSEAPPHQLRRIGSFDVTPEAGVHELDAWLLAGETIRPDAARLFRSRPGERRFQNPFAGEDGQPGVTFRWLEVEGPLHDQWPTAGHRLLFDDLPTKNPKNPKGRVEVVSKEPEKDARTLLAAFARRAYRRPIDEEEALRFLPVINGRLKAGASFADAMIAGYTAVLCSPEFIYIDEKPGPLDDHSVAARLAFFLTNSEPDPELRAIAEKGELRRPAILWAQTNRLIDDPKSRRFIDAFVDYWLDLRKAAANTPDATLYNDYYLDDLLAESAVAETQLFFAELLKGDLPARNLISSNFAMINERLADHYGLPGVRGVELRKVELPADSVRGGLLTQASILMITANGTTTSPVLRGAWIMERILGQPSPPPPPVPAVEPDLRGQKTIREQLAKHRDQASCATCHAKIDPPGFALESFDVMGGWRDRYRAIAEKPQREKGIGKDGQPFAFRFGPPVDCSGQMADGRKFSDIREFKRVLMTDESQIARNLIRQLIVYATGEPVGFGDREQVEQILEQTRPSGHGLRDLVHAIVQSDLFLHK
jgi:mono/diheme cytochrome c family protein